MAGMIKQLNERPSLPSVLRANSIASQQQHRELCYTVPTKEPREN